MFYICHRDSSLSIITKDYELEAVFSSYLKDVQNNKHIYQIPGSLQHTRITRVIKVLMLGCSFDHARRLELEVWGTREISGSENFNVCHENRSTVFHDVKFLPAVLQGGGLSSLTELVRPMIAWLANIVQENRRGSCKWGLPEKYRTADREPPLIELCYRPVPPRPLPVPTFEDPSSQILPCQWEYEEGKTHLANPDDDTDMPGRAQYGHTWQSLFQRYKEKEAESEKEEEHHAKPHDVNSME